MHHEVVHFWRAIEDDTPGKVTSFGGHRSTATLNCVVGCSFHRVLFLPSAVLLYNVGSGRITGDALPPLKLPGPSSPAILPTLMAASKTLVSACRGWPPSNRSRDRHEAVLTRTSWHANFGKLPPEPRQHRLSRQSRHELSPRDPRR